MTGNRAIKHWTLLLLSCCILLPSLLRAEEARGRESILIISSYNPDTRRMSSFITEFERQVVASGVPCDIYVETLECKSINDAPLWISQTDNLITRYESKGGLRAIVLLGQEAWASFVSLGRIPKEVMCFSCFVSSNGIVLPPPADSTGVWMPPSINYMNMVDSLHNVGGLLNKYDVRRNIELIRTLYPEVENIAFISDNTYGGISLQALVREEMENYPDLNLVLVDSRDGDEASHAAYASLPPRSAVMLGTWRVGSDGEYLMQRSLNDLVQLNPRLPVFSITQTGIGDVAVGGFVPNYENGANVIAAQIKEYYKTGSMEGAHFHLSDGGYVFDSRKLKELKIAEYALPKGSVIEDTVAAKLSKYSHYIELLVVGIVLLVLLLIFVAFLFLRTRRLKRTLEEREGQLVIAREKAEESDMLKSAFLANMSHEIRTPLNAIVGFSSLMQGEELSQEERAEYCAIVVNNSEMLLTLLNDILDISSLECGKIRFNYSAEEIVQICQHILMTTAHTCQPGGRGASRMRRRFVHAHYRRPPPVADTYQPADQCGQVHLRRQHRTRGGDLSRTKRGALLGDRHRSRHSARQAGDDLQPLRETRRQQEEGYRTGTGHLPSDRHDLRRPHLGRSDLYGRRPLYLRPSHRTPAPRGSGAP